MPPISRSNDARLAYSVAEATRVTGLGRSSLYILMAARELPYVKIGKRRLLRHVDLEALLAKLTRTEGAKVA